MRVNYPSFFKGFAICQLATSLGGEGHTLALATSGEVFSWGDGDGGKLGHGSTDRSRRPRPIEALRQTQAANRAANPGPTSSAHEPVAAVKFVAVGHRHSAVISRDGRLLTFGRGEQGCLGLGVATCKRTPELVATLKHVKMGQVACGQGHTVSTTP